MYIVACGGDIGYMSRQHRFIHPHTSAYEKIHHLFDTLNILRAHPRAKDEHERRNSIPNGRAACQEVYQGILITATEGGHVDLEAVQTG